MSLAVQLPFFLNVFLLFYFLSCLLLGSVLPFFSPLLFLPFAFGCCLHLLHPLKMSLAETKGKARLKLAPALLDVLVCKDVQRKSTLQGSDKKAALDPSIIAAIKWKLVQNCTQ